MCERSDDGMKCRRRVSMKWILFVIVITCVGIRMKNSVYLQVDDKKISASAFEETDITIVTAYFDIGRFPKGDMSNWRSKNDYFEWANVFKYIQNNLVVFTDSEVFRGKMVIIRKDLMTKTKIMSIMKKEAWPFQNLDKIAQIFNSTSYPKFLPNTVYPLYTCVQHAKYYLLEIAAEQNYFGTKYIMWLDVGYFRHRKSKALFYMVRPKGFDESKIAMTQARQETNFHHSPQTIIKRNEDAIGGGLVFGERHQMLKFTNQFKGAVNYFLNQNMTNTDQQIIYALFSDEGNQLLKPEVHLQMYKANNSMDWFYLGYYMIKEI